MTKNDADLAMRPALDGKWDEAIGALSTDRTDGTLGHETRGDSIEHLERIVTHHGARIDALCGVRIFIDHLGDTPVDHVLELELSADAREPYRRVARLLHVILRH